MMSRPRLRALRELYSDPWKGGIVRPDPEVVKLIDEHLALKERLITAQRGLRKLMAARAEAAGHTLTKAQRKLAGRG